MRVGRYFTADEPDMLYVMDGNELLVNEPMQPGRSLIGPRSAAEAKQRPWYYTGSPFGPQIVGLLWERHAGHNL